MSLFLILALLSADTEGSRTRSIPAPWGKLEASDSTSGMFQVRIDRQHEGEDLLLPADVPPLISAFRINGGERTPIPFELSEDGKEQRLRFTEGGRAPRADSSIVVETADTSGQRPDGRIVFHAGDAKLVSPATQRAGNGRQRWIPFGADSGGSASWDYKATRPGMYDIELVCSAEGETDGMVTVELAGTLVATKFAPTGSRLRYVARSVGRVYVPKPGEQTLQASGMTKSTTSPLRLLAVALRPACEGKPIAQAEDGTVTCHARDVTIRGVQVQYEPKPEKNTVGYWTIPADKVSWEFTLRQPGEFDVEILQGCGKGAGGSDVRLSVDGQPLTFVVEDTGHFQNFVPRRIGRVKLARPGRVEILVEPLRKAGVAVMDLRQVRLIPVQ